MLTGLWGNISADQGLDRDPSPTLTIYYSFQWRRTGSAYIRSHHPLFDSLDREFLPPLGVRGSSSHPHGMVQEAPELSFALAFDLDFGISLVPWGQIPSFYLKVIGEGLIGLGKFEYRQFDCGIIMGMLLKANNIDLPAVSNSNKSSVRPERVYWVRFLGFDTIEIKNQHPSGTRRTTHFPGSDRCRNVPFTFQEHGLDPDHDITSALTRPWPCISQYGSVEVDSVSHLNSVICRSYFDGIGHSPFRRSSSPCNYLISHRNFVPKETRDCVLGLNFESEMMGKEKSKFVCIS